MVFRNIKRCYQRDPIIRIVSFQQAITHADVISETLPQNVPLQGDDKQERQTAPKCLLEVKVEGAPPHTHTHRQTLTNTWHWWVCRGWGGEEHPRWEPKLEKLLDRERQRGTAAGKRFKVTGCQDEETPSRRRGALLMTRETKFEAFHLAAVKYLSLRLADKIPESHA